MARSEVRPDPVGEGQESVWEYPRPPALVRSDRLVVIRRGDAVIAGTRRAWRVLETSHPPTWYVPREDVAAGLLRRSSAAASVCEWKGAATYWDVVLPDRVLAAVGWSYETPTPRFVPITGHLSFMPGQIDCFIDGEQVLPQSGGFYGGWITRDVVGPFKGEPGSWGW